MDITSPTLLLDKEKCGRNIQRMADKATGHGVAFRPHFKTHISAEIGHWFRDFGVNKITVSSLKMAGYFAINGWQDITLAFPVNPREAKEINALAGQINFNILVESTESVTQLSSALKSKLGVYIKIDTGNHRTGLRSDNAHAISAVLQAIKSIPQLRFKGFLTHAGHSYGARSKAEIEAVHRHSVQQMRALKKTWQGEFPDLQISVGDTPSCSVAKDFEGVDEIRPGNFVFYDVMQTQIGSCRFDDIAVCLAAPVVAKHKERHQLVVHGGAVHLSKDFLTWGSEIIYGLVVNFGERGWSAPIEGISVSKLSQEHGIIQCNAETFGLFQIGDLLGILPVHSCLVADLMRSYQTLDGEIIPAMPH